MDNQIDKLFPVNSLYSKNLKYYIILFNIFLSFKNFDSNLYTINIYMKEKSKVYTLKGIEREEKVKGKRESIKERGFNRYIES